MSGIPYPAVLIPTYDNAGTLADVIREVRRHVSDVIVVDDGSRDGTAELLSGLKAEYGDGLTVLTHAENRGKGGALKTGFLHARRRGFTHVITIDSDGQHSPGDIPAFLAAVCEHPDAIIVGSRNLAADRMPARNTFANRFSNFWFRLYTGVGLPDTQTGFRAYPLDRLHGLGLLTSRYEAELELLVFASWHGTELVPIPIEVYYPPEDERVSHFRPVLDFARISLLNTALLFVSLPVGIPLRLRTFVRVLRKRKI